MTVPFCRATQPAGARAPQRDTCRVGGISGRRQPRVVVAKQSTLASLSRRKLTSAVDSRTTAPDMGRGRYRRPSWVPTRHSRIRDTVASDPSSRRQSSCCSSYSGSNPLRASFRPFARQTRPPVRNLFAGPPVSVLRRTQFARSLRLPDALPFLAGGGDRNGPRAPKLGTTGWNIERIER
jgi:hypothetical protein